jgi:general secretion pathway protein J
LSVTSSNKGLTLLEVLVAVVLISILSGVLYSSYFAVVRARDRAASGMEARRELGTTLDLLRREIAAAKFYRDDKSKILRFVVEDRDNFGKPASTLELTTTTPAFDFTRKESGVSNVQYRMVEKNKQFMLTRREQDIFQTSVTAATYPQIEVLSSFMVECSTDGSKWVKTWDTALNGALPKFVRITIQIVEEGKPVEFSVLASPKVNSL